MHVNPAGKSASPSVSVPAAGLPHCAPYRRAAATAAGSRGKCSSQPSSQVPEIGVFHELFYARIFQLLALCSAKLVQSGSMARGKNMEIDGVPSATHIS